MDTLVVLSYFTLKHALWCANVELVVRVVAKKWKHAWMPDFDDRIDLYLAAYLTIGLLTF